MDRVNISTAVETLSALYDALVSAYWDASDVFQKDTVFDILSEINAELNELNKLSIEDHLMPYEPVTEQLPACSRKFSLLQDHINEWFPRTKTAQELRDTLTAAVSLIKNKNA